MNDRPSGAETRDALAEVLEDQAARHRRREKPGPPPGEPGRTARVVAGPLAILTIWFVLSPPALLRPTPVPAPSMDDVRNGLYMDIYVVAAQVQAYREAHGRLPAALREALAEPDAAEGLVYSVDAGGDVFVLSGGRAGQEVRYRSTESLRDFVAAARSAVRAEDGGQR